MSAALSGAEPLLLVGAGKMGGAMLTRWLQRGLDGRKVTVLDPYLDAERRAALERNGVAVIADAKGAGGKALATIVLAVKPQSIDAVMPEIAPLAGAQTILVSIAAGVRLSKLQSFFRDGQPVVRSMPNTPAQVGQGMTVAVGNSHVDAAAQAIVDALLAAAGKVAWTKDEGLLDAVTAVSGSGPAYVFLLAECLAEAGRKAGLPDQLAEMLARQTVVGAGALLGESPLPAGTLRENVTSPKGTTAAALSVLMAEDGLQPLVTRAVEAAKKRSVELG
jgi:pyrroline-5-carboxylate reductase